MPIEVKSGKGYQRHSALTNILEISNYAIEESIIFTNYNVSVDGKCIYYPIYMIMFIENDNVELPKIEIEDLGSISCN